MTAVADARTLHRLLLVMRYAPHFDPVAVKHSSATSVKPVAKAWV